MKAEMEADPSICRVRREACIEVAQNYSNYLLSNLGRRIYFESHAGERARMPPPSASAFDIISWGRAEAKTPAGKARWECLNDRMPTSVSPPPEPVDPLPYLSPRPGLTYEEL